MPKLVRLLLAYFLFIFCTNQVALGATRSVYFTQTGQNTTTIGLSSQAYASCALTLRNPSTVSQTITIVTMITATGTGAGVGVRTSSNCNTTQSGSSSGNTATLTDSCTLAANSSVGLLYTFPAYPSRTPPAYYPGKQIVTCSGSITAVDATANGGFVIANAYLKIFSESSMLQTSGATGLANFGGYAVYSQLPISINKNKPF